MRQFTVNAQSRNNGFIVVAVLIGLLLMGAFGAFVMMPKDQGAPVRGAAEKPLLPGGVSR